MTDASVGLRIPAPTTADMPAADVARWHEEQRILDADPRTAGPGPRPKALVEQVLRDARTCAAVESEFFPCGERAPYSASDGGPRCGHHAALAVQADEIVVGPYGAAVRYDHIDGELYEVAS